MARRSIPTTRAADYNASNEQRMQAMFGRGVRDLDGRGAAGRRG